MFGWTAGGAFCCCCADGLACAALAACAPIRACNCAINAAITAGSSRLTIGGGSSSFCSIVGLFEVKAVEFFFLAFEFKLKEFA